MTDIANPSTPTPHKKYRWLRIIGRMLLIILLLLIGLILFIRSEWGQEIITPKVANFLKDKIGAEVSIDKLYITFDGNVKLDGVYIEDKKGDTLIYSNELEANIAFKPLINGTGFTLNKAHIEGLRTTVTRNDTITGFNFDFITEAFATTPSTPSQENTEDFIVTLGSLNLSNIDVVYNDSVTGIISRYKVDKLEVSMDEFDYVNMRFTASEGLIQGGHINIEQFPVYVDPDATPTPLPFLAFDALTLKELNGRFVSKDIGVDFIFDICKLYTEIPSADFNTFAITIDHLDLKDSDFGVKMNTITTPEVVASDQNNALFPDYILDFKNIRIAHTSMAYTLDGAITTSGIFNPNAVVLDDLMLSATNIFLKDAKVGGVIKTFSGSEASGISVHTLKGTFAFSDTSFSLQNFYTEINKNVLDGNIAMRYPSIAQITMQPEAVTLTTNISSFKVDLKDVFRFEPALRANNYFNTISTRLIKGTAVASGSLANLDITKMNAQWGVGTTLTAKGIIKDAMDTNKLYVDFPNIEIQTQKSALSKFVATDSLSIQLPEKIRLNGSLQGSLVDLQTKTTLTSSQGIAKLDGRLKNGERLAFDAVLNIQNYKLGELLKNEKLGNLTLALETSGSGASLNTLDATIDGTVNSLSLNNYAIKDLAVSGTIKNDKGGFKSAYKDENLNVNLDGTVLLDTISTQATATLNVIGADLEALGVMQRAVKTGFLMDASFKGNTKEYDVKANIEDGVVIYDNRTYLLGAIATAASIKPDSTAVSVTNKLIDLDLRSNKDPEVFMTAIVDHVRSYFYRDVILSDTIMDPVNVVLKGRIRQAPVLNEVFLVNMKDLDTISFDVDFAQGERELNALVTAPHINYAGNELDSLAFSLKSTKEDFDFDLGFNALKAGPISIKRTELVGSQRNNELQLDFLAFDDNEKLIHVASEITGNRERLRVHVLRDSLIFNKKKWEALPENEIIITDKKIAFNDFRFKRNAQLVEITDKISTLEKDHVAIDFQNFKLQEFLAYLNPDQELATGNLNGDLVVEEPFGDLGFLADLTVDRLKVLNEDLGVAALSGRSINGDRYDFNFEVSEGVLDMTLKGDYIANEDGAVLDMNLDIVKLKMEAIDGFSLGELKEGSGNAYGNFTLSGTLDELAYKGALNFKDAGFVVTKLNAPFLLKNESLSIDNSGFMMNSFTILDQNGNPFVVSGKIGTENLLNPTLDLNLTAQGFQALNATKEDNEFLYGTAVFDAKAKITGDLDIPIINIDATINPKTNITYVMPTAQANLESSDGIVIFVNRENPDAILTRTEEETGTIVGFDVTSRLRVSKEAQVTIIIDEETGDNLNVQGDGDFAFTLEPNGRMNLTGVYDIAGGKYEMNLYNLVNRTFTLDPGSKVKWSGDPFDAELDLRAIYSVETSAAPLMATQVSGSAPSIQTQYRQQLPFLVYLNIDGQLMSPKINFALDLPEGEQGALGGQVYGKVQQVNQQEGELNRQVFSLLVLNRFYPQSGADGSRGGFATIARDNLNDALSDQLNVFSDKLLGNTGFQLDFGLDSYTDYQGTSPQDRTQLDIAAQRKFFDDRLTVRVGSSVDVEGERPAQESGTLIGNVSLEYAITQDGQYRLKGFRRNEFENVIDGQTIVSGISLIFQQEFNQFSQLWDAILRKKKKELETEALEKAKATKDNSPSQEEDPIKNNR